MIAETRSYIFRWRSRYLRRRLCLSSLLFTSLTICISFSLCIFIEELFCGKIDRLIIVIIIINLMGYNQAGSASPQLRESCLWASWSPIQNRNSSQFGRTNAFCFICELADPAGPVPSTSTERMPSWLPLWLAIIKKRRPCWCLCTKRPVII